MNDPCVRKSTNPPPVIAPQKMPNTVGQMIEDLILFNSECGGKVVINSEGDKVEKVNESEQCSTNDVIEKMEEKRLEPSGSNTKVETLEEDLTLSDEEEEGKKWKLVPLKSPEPKKSTGLKLKNYPPNSKTTTKMYKSKEFISISDSEDSENEERRSTQQKRKLNKNEEVPSKKVKLISPINPKESKHCKYLFKNHPKKGETCGLLTKEDFCNTHKKIMTSGNLRCKQRIEHMDTQISEIKDSFNKKEKARIEKLRVIEGEIASLKQKEAGKLTISALEKEVNSLKETVRNLQSNLQELQNKFDHIMTENKVEELNKKKIKTTKICRLNRDIPYKLTQYVGDEGVLESQAGTFKLKIPASMERPKIEENPILKYNDVLQRFEWLKMSGK